MTAIPSHANAPYYRWATTLYNFIPFPINSALVLGIACTVVYLTVKVLPKSVSRAMGLR